MSEETKNEEVVEKESVEETKNEEVVEKESVEEKKPLTIDLSNGIPEEIEEDTNDDIFVTEDDTFEVNVEFYFNDDKLFVKSVDENEYDPIGKNVRSFSATFKHPSQADLETIMANVAYKSPEFLEMKDIISLELVRMGILLRKWTLTQKLERIVELDPKIIKGMMNSVRDVIGMDGIV